MTPALERPQAAVTPIPNGRRSICALLKATLHEGDEAGTSPLDLLGRLQVGWSASPIRRRAAAESAGGTVASSVKSARLCVTTDTVP
jgi:hypothetical protein